MVQLMSTHPGPTLNALRVAFPAAVEAYDPERGECCDMNNFRVDFDGMANSPWNLSCARVFAKSFITRYPEYESLLPHGHQFVETSWLAEFSVMRSRILSIV
jgi:hypothetical protein